MPGASESGRADAPILLQTKLHPPVVSAQVVPRDRLFAKLCDGRGRRLTLVACPAGFGKSTLLAAWRQAEMSARPVAWVTLDGRDDDVVVLWLHVIEALGRVLPAVKELASLVPVAPLLDVVLPRLVNALCEEGDVALVLDDFHRLSGRAARESVAWLVEHLPLSVQLVLAGRMDPALPLGALRARGQLLELRAGDLRFTDEEATEFLNTRLDLGLDPADIASLVARTGGWPAGIYLAALSLSGKPDKPALLRAFDGTSAHVVDYLADEVLAGYTPELQRFMLHASVLERFCPELCDHVLEQTTSAAILDELARSNLFLLPLGGRRRWFRFHHLFAQLLQVELERGEPDLVPRLHRRASAWHRASGTTDEAIHHALAAHAYGEAGELIGEAWVHYVNAGRSASVLDWLSRIAEPALSASPRLLLVHAWVLAMRGRLDEMRRTVARVRALGALEDGPLPDGMASIESSLALLNASFGGGDVAGRLADGRRAAALEGRDSPWYPVATWALGWAHFCNDELDRAEAYFEETAALGPAADQWVVTAASIADLSLIAGMRGQRETQARRAAEAYELARAHGLLDAIEVGEVPTARGVLLAASGDLRAALPELERGVRLRRLWAQPLDLVDSLLALAPVAGASGLHERANELFDEAERVLAACPDPGALPRRLAAVRRGAVVPATDLSERELTVLRLLGGGSSEREIAHELVVSFNTVHSHVKSIYRKLGVSSRADALARARGKRLIT